MDKNIELLEDKISKLEKELKSHKLIYRNIDQIYDIIKKEASSNNIRAKYRKEWIDNNWDSITKTFADQILDMADNSFKSLEVNQKND